MTPRDTILDILRSRFMGASFATPAAKSTADLEAELATERAAKMELARQLAEAVARAEAAETGRKHWLTNCQEWVGVAARRGKALHDIAAQETPGANATVKRMARIAREALE